MNKAAINVIGEDRCAGCFGCYNACKQNAIEMILNAEGFIVPKINQGKCINCGLCQNNCPVINKMKVADLTSPKIFGAWIKDEAVRIESSSGGIFTAVANSILEQGGVVFGVSFDSSFNKVEHIIVQDEKSLNKIRGSKYIQSDVGFTYKKVIEFAAKGKKVLFSGTPCQIAALNTFLKDKETYRNVITCEMVCHGVPSQSVFLDYVNYLQRKYDSKIIKYNFRDKKSGWDDYNYSVEIDFSNKKKYFKNNKEESFMRGYLKNIYLRESCYDCLFASLPRVADITLGDFWGLGRLDLKNIKQQDINKGVSVVLINTKKGLDFFNAVDNIEKFETDIDTVKKYNPRVDSSRYEIDVNKRKKFYEFLKSGDFNIAIKKTVIKPGKIKRLINFFRN